MRRIVAQKAVFVLILLFLFSTCGELDNIFPPNGTYQVRTLVNGSAIEECSIIRASDKIRPYFAVSVVNDPDLIGMLVYIQNAQGEVIGDKIRYILEEYAEEIKADTNQKDEANKDESNKDDKNQIKPDTEKTGETALTAGNDSNTQSKQDADKDEDTVDEKIGKTSSTSTTSSTNTSTSTNTTSPTSTTSTSSTTSSTSTAATTVTNNESTGKTLNDYSDSSVTKERWGFTDTKALTNKNEAAVEIAVKSLDNELPYIPLPKNLEIGAYTIIFEALGKKEILSHTETNIFYVGSVEFNLKDISMYLPGISESQLISPGTIIMLEAGLDFDSRLDPYIIWYYGKNIIGEGKISEGAGRILWKTPEQAGFYSVRAEAFPFRLKRSISGMARDITMPISPKAVNQGYFFDNNTGLNSRSPLTEGTIYHEQVQLIQTLITAINEDTEEDSDEETEIPAMPDLPELLRWYQFEGRLRDSLSQAVHDQSLTAAADKIPHWAPAGQSYGLSVELDDIYQLSPLNFIKNGQYEGGGIFLLHVRLPAEGTIFNVFFPLQSSINDGVWMEMVKEKNSVTLRLNTGKANGSSKSTTTELPVYLAPFGTQELIPIVVEFYLRDYRLEAKISLSGDYPQTKSGSIDIPGILTGEGRIKLGGQFQSSIKQPEKVPEEPVIPVKTANSRKTNEKTVTPEPVLTTTDKPESQLEEFMAENTDEIYLPEEDAALPQITELKSEPAAENTIWDELAILFSSIPVIKEELFPEEITEEQEAPEEVKKKDTDTLQVKNITQIINADTKAVAEPKPVLPEETAANDSPEENISAEINNAESEKTIEADTLPAELISADTVPQENPAAPAADTDTEEPSMERENIAAFADNS